MSRAKNVAKALLSVEAVRLNVAEPFTFVSGIKSPIYCDNRKMIGYPEDRNVIIEGFVEMLKDVDFDVVAGTATAGIPWAAFIADRMNKPMAYIRSKPKAHGAGKQIEGLDVEGKKVIVVEDLISTGGSVITALEAVRREGGEVVEVSAIFTYNFEKAETNFKNAEAKLSTLVDFATMLETAKENNYITAEEVEVASQWNKNPSEWGK